MVHSNRLYKEGRVSSNPEKDTDVSLQNSFCCNFQFLDDSFCLLYIKISPYSTVSTICNNLQFLDIYIYLARS